MPRKSNSEAVRQLLAKGLSATQIATKLKLGLRSVYYAIGPKTAKPRVATRAREIKDLRRQGCSDREIARRLGISRKSISQIPPTSKTKKPAG